ncbi:hypothetical protein M426DRAFT_233523 [Hypoxylon sp. CI-4A]|nr:hypothetical protein M426DRAFT_233523 [Hypoxylon sp. CI-4A]
MALESTAYCVLVWIMVLIGSTAAVELGDDIKTLVPTCAQSCLDTFIKDNYPVTDCTSNPSLDCICSEQSNSGYTIGEGALECISAEVQSGRCDDNVAGGSVKHDAYIMCSKIAEALPNTHSVLTAIISDAPTGSSSPSSTILTAMPTATEAVPTSAQSESTMSSLTSTTISATSSMITNTATPVPEHSNTPALSSAQVAGIVVGVVGALLLSIIAILVARCIRRRRFGDLEDGLTPLDDNRIGKSDGMIISGPLDEQPTRKLEPNLPYSHNMHPPRFPTIPSNPRTPPGPGLPSKPSNPFLSPRPSEEVIGLGISRSTNTTPSSSPKLPTHRPQSRLLPAKPVLGLNIAPPRPSRPAESLSRLEPVVTREAVRNNDRASVMTTATAFADLDVEVVDYRRPLPSTMSGQWRRSLPKKNNDKSHQVELPHVSEVAELDTYTPMTKSPVERNEEAAAMAEAISAASVLSGSPELGFFHARSLGINDHTIHQSSQDLPYGSIAPHRKESRDLPVRSDTVKTYDSVTTINTDTEWSSPIDGVPFELDSSRMAQLSAIRRMASTNPYQGPEAKSRLNQAMPRPDPSNKRNLTRSPRTQSSTTLGDDVQDTTVPYPQSLNTKHSQDSRTPNPARITDVEEDLVWPPRLDEMRLPTQSPMSHFSTRAPSMEPRVLKSSHSDKHRFSPNPAVTNSFQPPSPVSSRPGTTDSRHRAPRVVSPDNTNTRDSEASNPSSLLAKRVGKGKAAALTLTSNDKKRRDQWAKENDPNSISGMDDGISSAKGSLPFTPTWKPKLTPTRHGDDLYLNVQ